MATTFSYEMGLSHDDFFRQLPAAMGDIQYTLEGSDVRTSDGDRRITIALGNQAERSIALITLPYTPVTFTFEGYDQAEIDAFMKYFMARYQRGGG